jgi:iron complex transport system ATP-binding protein
MAAVLGLLSWPFCAIHGSAMSSNSSKSILEIRNMSVVRNGNRILRKLSWSINKGEHWAILGPNGSGKSSLLSALAGYLTPTEGECSVLGETFGETDWREVRSHLGVVSSTVAAMVPLEEPTANTVLTGRNSGIGLWGEPSEEDLEEARLWLKRVELKGLEDRPWEVLSQGEKQRVLIARALISKPAILVLDEPCAGLDPVARESFLAFLERLIHPESKRPHHPSVVLVTHHVEEITPSFTHALLMKEGKAYEAGPIHKTLRSKALSKVFITPVELKSRKGRFFMRVPPPSRGIL